MRDLFFWKTTRVRSLLWKTTKWRSFIWKIPHLEVPKWETMPREDPWEDYSGRLLYEKIRVKDSMQMEDWFIGKSECYMGKFEWKTPWENLSGTFHGKIRVEDSSMGKSEWETPWENLSAP